MAELKLYTYRLLVGRHEDNDPFYTPETSDAPKTKARYLVAGDTFQTTQRLHFLNGGGGLQPKFELLTESSLNEKKVPHPYERQEGETAQQYAQRLAGIAAEAATAAGLTLESNKPAARREGLSLSQVELMSESELRKYAEEEEIDLKGLSGKAAVLKAVKAAFSS